MPRYARVLFCFSPRIRLFYRLHLMNDIRILRMSKQRLTGSGQTLRKRRRLYIASRISTRLDFAPPICASKPAACQHSLVAPCLFSQPPLPKRQILKLHSHPDLIIGACFGYKHLDCFMAGLKPLEVHCILLSLLLLKPRPCSNLFSAKPLINHSLLH